MTHLTGNMDQNLREMDWLIGTWKARNSPEKAILEHWNKASDLTFEGVGLIESGDTRKEQETLRIVAMSGEIFYLAKVSHNPFPTAFKLTRQSQKELVFENPDHDFPKKIVYRLITEDSLEVSVTGAEEKGFTLRFQRQP